MMGGGGGGMGRGHMPPMMGMGGGRGGGMGRGHMPPGPYSQYAQNPNLMMIGQRQPQPHMRMGMGGQMPMRPRGGLPPRPVMSRSPPVVGSSMGGPLIGSMQPGSGSSICSIHSSGGGGGESHVGASPAVAVRLPAVEEPHNECEIIIMSKSTSLDLYAELIEKSIKEIGLSVDLMYPKPDIKLGEFIPGLGKRGTKFAVLLRADNEARRSISLHVLKSNGKAEEHRNMPLPIAYGLMKEAKTQLRREEVTKMPEEVKIALHGVIEDKLISDKQYQSSIKYLIHRWKKQHELEGRTEFDPETGILSELQVKRKIAKILGAEEDEAEPENNPRVQQAIENLLSNSTVLNALRTQNTGPAITERGSGPVKTTPYF